MANESPAEVTMSGRRPWFRRASLGGSVLLSVGVLACRWCRPDGLVPITIVPAWCWLVPGFVLLWLGSADRSSGRRSRATWGALAVWVLFVAVEVEELRGVARGWCVPSAASWDVRVVTLNVGDGGVRSLRALAPLEPDVVLVQEAPGTDGLRAITRELFGEDGAFVTVGDSAILARGRVVPVDARPGSHFVRAEVRLPGRPSLDVVSLRLHPPPPRLDVWSPGFWRAHRNVRETHREEVQEIVRSLGEPGPRTIVGGDFNTVPADAALDPLRADLADAFTTAGRGWGPTGASSLPIFRIDQVWVGTRVRAVTARAFSTGSSDHRAVVCDLVLPR